jgi:hypothetical protein
VKGKCVRGRTTTPTQSLAIGSTMKLWVLLALDEKLHADKKLSWDTKLAIRDEGEEPAVGDDAGRGRRHRRTRCASSRRR